MKSALDSLLELPWPIVAGWMLFLALGALQLVWYRRARVVAPVVQPPAAPRTVRSRAARTPDADNAGVDTLPAIDLDSIADTTIGARSQTVLGL